MYANLCIVLVYLILWIKQEGNYYRDDLTKYTINIYKLICFLQNNSS